MIENKEKKDNVIRFKQILLELHRGAEPSKLFDEFHEVISSADKRECEEIKQQLIIEGVPKRHAKKWSATRIAAQAN